ncbi:MAG: NAD-dependent epimerase/dehydratase family protein [Elusimicrobia bacterium]|nr:NAD-dependent epimerase/dehydratase family protein [Elusimicrobiota bacterium]
MDKAFLTGGTGFVGANLARLLVREGFEVRALARAGSDRRNLRGLPVDILEGDLQDGAALEAGCRGCRYVFHVAADYRLWVRDPEPMYAANVLGTAKALEAAGKAGAERIVHCSSVAAVKLREDIPADESSQYASTGEIVSHYKKSKWLSERKALELAARGLPVVIVNPAAPIGPWDAKPTPTGRLVVDFLNGRMPSYVDTGLNVVHAADVAAGHLLAARKGRVGERYILGCENLTLKRYLDLLAELTGLRAPRFETPYALALAFGALDTARARLLGGEPLAPLDAVRMARHKMYFDSSKAVRELGLPQTPARRALADAARWFAENGYVKDRRTARQVLDRLGADEPQTGGGGRPCSSPAVAERITRGGGALPA